ncbi:putative surface protein with fasciclin (FAS1) repeats [Novosphingobium hassiacum]|uniref:Putative surface protein with fasciclin (FAS1) repeats n=1 Tax=Novosphingobium hassiacum TaxID=173676 RepID=A0A7W6A0V2_9SPHN|nr:putative surface protein with fasciclin (FAS1) repeats [Novosphingobium hassiacum]
MRTILLAASAASNGVIYAIDKVLPVPATK